MIYIVRLYMVFKPSFKYDSKARNFTLSKLIIIFYNIPCMFGDLDSSKK